MAKRAKPKARADHRNDQRTDPRATKNRPALAAAKASTSKPSEPLEPSTPGGPIPGPPPDAVAAFERAMEAMQRHHYAEAAASFKALISRFPAERALLDRARVYLDLCERELLRQPPTPKTVEERLTAATAALNFGEDRKAEKLAASVLAEEPRQDLALYLLAAIEARRDAADAALAYLGKAIAVSPEARAQARLDNDFESLRDNERFRDLVDPHGTGAAGAGRRARKGRAER